MWGGVITIIYSTWGLFIQSANWIKFTISLVCSCSYNLLCLLVTIKSLDLGPVLGRQTK
jgi:hypothetical protein